MKGLKNRKLLLVDSEDLKDKHFGKVGTTSRDLYEFELKMEILKDATTHPKASLSRHCI